MLKKIELLAPAGSFDVMKACFSAGADAVYMGLSRFSARAYAENSTADEYCEAIDYAHVHGKKLYLTVNTLMKEKEIPELLETLRPLYKAGLDAVIVQDFGAMKAIHEAFPDLPIHISTQATVTGPGAVKLLKHLGITRVVPARELSLPEIRKIYDETGIEIECFVHGALCYCYSGQCLFSSVVGGRSGNRGRCAQPCRMEYKVTDEKGHVISKKNEPFVLSMKDLNTLEILPEILDAGVMSLKIEGRMKRAEYAAGVTSVYRKYLDLAMNDPENYRKRIDPEDLKTLYNLFNRDGFTEGYYKERNGSDMIALREKEHRLQSEDLYEAIRKQYVDTLHKTPVSVTYYAKAGEPLTVCYTVKTENGEVFCSANGETALEPAKNGTGLKVDLETRLCKLGDTDFTAETVSGTFDPGAFIPVSLVNNLRREAVRILRENILNDYRRN